MNLRSHRVIGLEVTASKIRMVEIDTSSIPFKVSNFAIIDIFSMEPENIAKQIKSIYISRGFRTKRVNVAVDKKTAHYMLTLPSMPRDDMERVVEREVKERASLTEKIVIGWEDTGEIEEGGVKKRQILATVSPAEAVSKLYFIIEKAGLRCERISTIPLSLLSATGLTDGIGGVAFIYLQDELGYLVFSYEGRWCFSREFPVFSKEATVSAIRQASLFFREKFRAKIERIILGGEVEKTDIIPYLEENLGIKTEVFNPNKIDLRPLGKEASIFKSSLHLLPVPLGLATIYNKHAIDMVPEQIKKKIKERKIRSISAVAFLLIFLTSFLWYPYSSKKIVHLERSLNQKMEYYEKIRPALEKISVIENQRKLYKEKLSLLKQMDKQKVSLIQILKDLSLITPDQILLTDLEIKSTDRGLKGGIKGEIMASDAFFSHKVFNEFYCKFKSLSYIENVEFVSAKGGKNQFEISFEILNKSK